MEGYDAEKRAERFRWKAGDVIIYKSLEDMKKQLAKEGKKFIPVRQEKEKGAD